MTMPPCFQVLNDGWFESVVGQINSVSTAAELQALVNQVYGDVALLNSTIEGQLALLGPLEALLTAPLNPVQAVTWVTNFITGFLQPYLLPLTKYVSQLAALEAQVTTMTAAIEAVAALKFPDVDIVIPPVDPFCTI